MEATALSTAAQPRFRNKRNFEDKEVIELGDIGALDYRFTLSERKDSL